MTIIYSVFSRWFHNEDTLWLIWNYFRSFIMKSCCMLHFDKSPNIITNSHSCLQVTGVRNFYWKITMSVKVRRWLHTPLGIPHLSNHSKITAMRTLNEVWKGRSHENHVFTSPPNLMVTLWYIQINSHGNYSIETLSCFFFFNTVVVFLYF